MDWDFFKAENGKFRAKRLPSPQKSTVKFKDVTDLACFREDLREADTFTEAIKEYKNHFDSFYSYEVELETFDEVFDKNRNKFLGKLGFLKNESSPFHELLDFENDEADWILVDNKTGSALLKAGIVDRKEELNQENWVNFLSRKYRVPDLADLTKGVLKLTGKKAEKVEQLYQAIMNGAFQHPEPIGIRPNAAFGIWLASLQEKYVNELESALGQFPYPLPFTAAVWDLAISDNADWDVIGKTIRIRHEDALKHIENERAGSKPSKLLKFLGLQPQIKIEEISIPVRNNFEPPPNSTIPMRVINFNYVNTANNPSQRKVELKHLWLSNNCIYLNGFCHTSDEDRTFRMDRIQGSIQNHDNGTGIQANEIQSIETLQSFLQVSQKKKSPAKVPWLLIIAAVIIIYLII